MSKSNHATANASTHPPADNPPKKAPIWDLPLRVFHWGLLVSVAGSMASGINGDMFWHEKLGLNVLGLLVFRIIWGFVGSHHARFHNFIRAPKAVIAYIKSIGAGDRTHQPGHSPTGGYATMVILGVMLVMSVTGAMSRDDIFYDGPLVPYVGGFADDATTLHRLGEKFVFLTIALHLLALLFYRFMLKIKLVPAMVNGGTSKGITPISRRHQAAGFLLMVIAVGLAHCLSTLT